MDTIRKQVPIEEVPESWREALGDAREVVVTLEPAPAPDMSVEQRRKEDEAVIAAVAGLWRDRPDVDELFAETRELRRKRYENSWSED